MLDELLTGLLDEGRRVELRVTGASMRPFLRSRDLVTVRPAATARLGDVVLIRLADSRLLIHRVVGRGAGGLATRGDAAGSPDAGAAGARLLGRVVSIRRDGRPRRLGLGPERVPIAILSRSGMLYRIHRLLRAMA
jgi:phage repressor protein C with HTH and peptisase S24 domain